MGANTIVYTTPIRRISRHLVVRTGTLVPTGTYATGGDTFAPVVGKDILQVSFENPAGRIIRFDKAASKILWYEDGATVAGALDEVPNATDLTANTVRWKATGTR